MSTKVRTAKSLALTVLRPVEPGYLILYVNNVCNLRCHMCLVWDQMQVKTNDLSLTEHVELSKSFRNLLQLTVTGGEPLLREDVPHIVHAYYAHSGLAKCTLVTNATYPDKTERCVQEIFNLCPDLDLSVNVSIDGPPEVHEQVRGVKGCFEKTARTLDRLIEMRSRRKNMIINVTSVISKMNWQYLDELYEFIRQRFDVDQHAFLLARGRTKDADAKEVPLKAYRWMERLLAREDGRSKHYLSLPMRALSRAMRSLVARTAHTNEFVIPCVAGGQFIEVFSDGEVVPCEIIEEKRDPYLGNVRDFDLDIVKLLQSPKAVEMRNFIKQTKCRCTFECALYASLAFNPVQYPRVLARTFS